MKNSRPFDFFTQKVAEFWTDWVQFWFSFHHPVGLALMRIQLAAVMLYMYVIRQAHNLDQFTDEGLIPRALALKAIPEFYRPAFPWFFWPDSLAQGVHFLFLLLLLMMLLGVRVRAYAWLIWILHLGFIQRNYAILFGADVISSVLLFYLAFTRSDERLSLSALWRKKRKLSEPSSFGDPVSSAFTRLIQIQISVIYAYTGLEKLKGITWWDGTALWSVLGNPQMVMYDMSFLRSIPLVVSFLTFFTIVFEIYWPAAMLRPGPRKLWLFFGLMFHCGIGFLMGLWTFSLVMMSTYFLFLSFKEPLRLKVGSRSFEF